MKKINRFLPGLSLVLAILAVGCGDDYDNVAPGNYVSTERIETFPGDTVLVTGTASNGSAITNVSLVCEAWGIHKVYDRTPYEDNVFNYEYQLVVPDDATFNQTLTVTVATENGLSTVREIPMSFLPDTTSPRITSTVNAQEGIDFDTSAGQGFWNMSYTVADDRELDKAVISVPTNSYYQEVKLSGRQGSINETIEFKEAGTHPVSIQIYDASGNMAQYNVDAMVMLAEVEDPIKDYAGMYVIDASENPEDYVDGYYRYMDRMGEYIYQGKFYAATDNAKMLFTPERSIDGDLYGVSPYVSSKLMNKNGYVVPVTIEKAGYYGVYIDLQAHTVSTWALDIPADACTEDVWLSGTGFTFGDWGAPAEAMSRNGYRYTINAELVSGYTGDYCYYFYTSGWARVFRGDAEGKWWFESADGACVTFKTNYSGLVTVTFDSAHHWGTIKKSK